MLEFISGIVIVLAIVFVFMVTLIIGSCLACLFGLPTMIGNWITNFVKWQRFKSKDDFEDLK